MGLNKLEFHWLLTNDLSQPLNLCPNDRRDFPAESVSLTGWVMAILNSYPLNSERSLLTFTFTGSFFDFCLSSSATTTAHNKRKN